MKKLCWLVAISILIFVFFYKLGDTALLSYDEAWYAEIARNILRTKNVFQLQFNGSPFIDHPPLGYILSAISIGIFGNSEFSARFFSAAFGLGTIIVVFLIGKKIKSWEVGVAAAGILLSSMWFIFRSRSGNLDVPFMFWESLTVYFLLHRKEKYLYFSVASFAALLLTKTLVGVGLLPVIVFILWTRRKELKPNVLVKSATIFIILVSPWYLYNQMQNSGFLYHHFIEIGTRGDSNTYSIGALHESLRYLAIGVGKWYKVFLTSVLVSIACIFLKKKDIFNWSVLFLWFAGFSVFLFSSETQIWHLLPLYPILSLIIPFSLISLGLVTFRATTGQILSCPKVLYTFHFCGSI